MAYLWRNLTTSQRERILEHRQLRKRPWHHPPHFDQGACFYHVVGACYEHKDWIGNSPDRMDEFCKQLLDVLASASSAVGAWCVLPNHYHALIWTADIRQLAKILGQLHGRTSLRWNREESMQGRKVWHGASDRAMRGERHYWATVNYIHHNPVKHGYVRLWQNWPYSSVHGYLEEVGREEAQKIWRDYPVLDYGKGWDD